ncbi:hypothetical protein GCM10007063_00420 [Lentibacillus kapialis]|uniref:Uncharacterized protein n=1 Tax=Lentibacillus kapialis TaxID=340214 RepID=A0A917US53_9BACI|nr:hypothetical protein GCM10007063_00420 [Lentibacillus kapialis]
MVIELLYELLADTSPFYFYFGIFLTLMGTIKITRFGLHKFVGHAYMYTKNSHSIQILSVPIRESIGAATDILVWIAQKAKRIDAPDDDNDHRASFFLSKLMKKQGGIRWIEHLYSHSRRNIALSA